jgi:cytoskeletal protein CcmA (bactofilin family)
MFNNKSPNKVNGTSSQSPSLNMISEGTKLKGTINSQNDIRIAGKVDGEVVAKGKLIVTSTGHVEGDVKVADADVAGKVEGTIKVSGKLNLRQSAVINGDIYTKTLIVEEGAEINGACKMGGELKSFDQATDSEFAKATKVKSEEEKKEK